MIKEAGISATNAPTLRKLPERMTLRVISPKKRSTRLSQEEEVGVRVQMEVGMTLEPGDDLGMFVSGVVVADNVNIKLGGRPRPRSCAGRPATPDGDDAPAV